MNTFVAPPARNRTPTIIPIANLRLPASKVAPRAPTRVPIAWARKGKRKCIGWNRGIEALRPSMVSTSAPAGGGTTLPLTRMRPILTMLPRMRPQTAARMFLTMGFKVSSPSIYAGHQYSSICQSTAGRFRCRRCELHDESGSSLVHRDRLPGARDVPASNASGFRRQETVTSGIALKGRQSDGHVHPPHPT